MATAPSSIAGSFRNGAIDTSTTVGKFVKNIAKAFYKTAPYLTEGATQINTDEVVGKSVGEEYTFKVDDVDVTYSSAGMQDDDGLSNGVSSRTANMKIVDALAFINNNALDRKLAFGNWEDFVQTCGAKVARKLTAETALADLGKGEASVACDDVNGLVAKLYEMTQWGTCRGYGSFAGVGHILGTSKLNAPVYMNDKYSGSNNGVVFANLEVLRGIELPTMTRLQSSNVATVSISTAGVVTATGGTPAVGEVVKVTASKELWVYFPSASDLTKAIVIGDKEAYSSALSGATIIAPEADETYEPIIVRADGAQGYLDASSLVESADEVGSSDGVGIAHSERNNSKGGKIHRFDACGAFGVADTKRTKVYLLKTATAE